MFTYQLIFNHGFLHFSVLIDFLVGEVLSVFAYEINSPSSRYGKSVSSHKDLLTDLEASFILFNQDVYHIVLARFYQVKNSIFSFVPLKRCKRRCEASPSVKGALVTSGFKLSSRCLGEWSRARRKLLLRKLAALHVWILFLMVIEEMSSWCNHVVVRKMEEIDLSFRVN
nr:hypothetical protein [Tanacetum cinerariifolium]